MPPAWCITAFNSALAAYLASNRSLSRSMAGLEVLQEVLDIHFAARAADRRFLDVLVECAGKHLLRFLDLLDHVLDRAISRPRRLGTCRQRQGQHRNPNRTEKDLQMFITTP
jgi:hypothetical protein